VFNKQSQSPAYVYVRSPHCSDHELECALAHAIFFRHSDDSTRIAIRARRVHGLCWRWREISVKVQPKLYTWSWSVKLMQFIQNCMLRKMY